jgi:hypothetical protein
MSRMCTHLSSYILIIGLLLSACSSSQAVRYKIVATSEPCEIPSGQTMALSLEGEIPSDAEVRWQAGQGNFSKETGFTTIYTPDSVTADSPVQITAIVTTGGNSTPLSIKCVIKGNSLAAPGTSPIGIPGPTVPTSTTNPARTGQVNSIRCAVTAFGSYYPTIQIAHDKLDRANNFALEIIPLSLKQANGDIANEYSNEELYGKVRSGEFDCVLTTLDVFPKFGNFGAITAIIDESAGADQIWAKEGIPTINDFSGKTITYVKDSASEFMLYSTLDIVGLGAADFTPKPFDSMDKAVGLFNQGGADVISGWEPNITNDRKGGQLVVDSNNVRFVIDVIVFSHQAIENKPDAVQAFHKAWFQALKQQFENRELAAESIADWGENEWTGIRKEASKSDLEGWLHNLAQANLDHNIIVMKNLDIIRERLKHAHHILTLSSPNLPSLDMDKAVDPRFVLALAQDSTLKSSLPPINASFRLSGEPRQPSIPPDKIKVVATLDNCPTFSFLPDSTELTPDDKKQLDTCALPILRKSTLYLRITGSSAWPGPPGRFTEERIRGFARDRAIAIADYLIDPTQGGIDSNRIVFGEHLIPPPERQGTTSEEEMQKDRFVKLELVTPGGR